MTWLDNTLINGINRLLSYIIAIYIISTLTHKISGYLYYQIVMYLSFPDDIGIGNTKEYLTKNRLTRGTKIPLKFL